jgi:hypothetical protein
MLFFGAKQDLLAGLPVRRPKYRHGELSPYSEFDNLGADYHEDPYHFAPGLIRMIAGAPDQEIGTHTFSHYYCLEDGQTADDFKADLEAAIAAAKQLGIVLKSIVFPRNQYASPHLAICEALGFTAYRGNPEIWFWRPRKTAEDSLTTRAVRLLDAYVPLSGHDCWAVAEAVAGPLVNVKASRFLRPVGPAITKLDSLRLHRIKCDMQHAARQGCVYHLWWHPENFGQHPTQNLEFLGAVLDRFDRLRAAEGMQSLNMGELAEVARVRG